MSWLNLSDETPKGSGIVEWQSTQEFTACPYPRHAASATNPARTAERAAATPQTLFRNIAIDTHHDHENKSKDAEAGDPGARACGFIALKEGQQQPEQSGQAATEYAQNLPIDDPHFRGNELECLVHEEEVPLRLDSRRGRRKRFCLHAEV